MKTAIKLILIYFAIQITTIFLMMIPFTIYNLLVGTLDGTETEALAPAMFVSLLLMGLYLSKKGYISKEKTNWSIVSPAYLLLTVLMTLSAICVLDALVSPLHLPDFMENQFDLLLTGWLGIVCTAIIAPVLEELLFRGVITKTLLKTHSPWTAILLSGLVFGVIHINPAQVLPAVLIGILLGWIYYKTASLIPCILIHIINNSLSVYLSLNYPEVETMNEFVGGDRNYFMITGAAVGVLMAVIYLMNKYTVKYPWKKEETIEIITNNDLEQ